MSTLKTTEEQLRNQMDAVKSHAPKAHNEEFLAYNSVDTISAVSQEFLSKVNKTKFARKSQTEFLKTCCDIVQKISTGGVQPVNQLPESEHDYFIYSDLFVSKTKSNSDNWRISPNDQDIASYSVVNSELRNLQQLLNIGVPHVNLINTVLVDRLGQRFILQNLLEGMLYFHPERWGKYGSFDEGKTFVTSPNFDLTMARICNALWLTKDNKFQFKDKDTTKEVKLHGSSEVKGILAGDGRYYVMDLLRISPRDVNFKDQVEHQSCVFRPELIKNYQMIQSWKKIYEQNMKKMEEMKKKKKEEGEKEEEKKEGEEEDKKEKKDEEEKVEEDKREKKVEEEKKDTKTNEDQTRLTLNPSLYTTILPNNEDLKHQEDVKNLDTMAEYLIKEALPAVLAELTDQTTKFGIIDCETLIQLIHKNGVNTRYLGHLYALVTTDKKTPKKGYEWVQRLISFTILMRSVVKYIREQIQKFEHESAIEISLHCLNLLLGDEGIRKQLAIKYDIKSEEDKEVDQKEETTTTQVPQNEVSLVKKKNKRKRKKKKKKKISEAISSNPHFQSGWFKLRKPLLSNDNSFKGLTFGKMQKRLLEIAQKKYSFKGENLDFNLVQSHGEKMRFLREVFMKLALKLNPDSVISFKVEDSMSKGTFRAPLKANDISQIGFRVKGITHYIDEIRYNILAAEKDFKKGQTAKAIQSLEMYLPIVINIYGMFHLEIIKILIRLGSFYAQTNNISKAISYQTLAYLVSLKLNGPQDINTANALTHLSNSLFRAEKFDISLRVLKYCLKSWDLIGGSLNPLSFKCLTEIQNLALRMKNMPLLEIILKELEKRNSELYGRADQRNLGWLAQLARLKATKGDFQTAVDLQTRHSFILRQLVRRYEDTQKKTEKQEMENKKNQMSYLEYYKMNLMKNFEESEKLKVFYKSKLSSN
jgi:protein TIF31